MAVTPATSLIQTTGPLATQTKLSTSEKIAETNGTTASPLTAPAAGTVGAEPGLLSTAQLSRSAVAELLTADPSQPILVNSDTRFTTGGGSQLTPTSPGVADDHPALVGGGLLGNGGGSQLSNAVVRVVDDTPSLGTARPDSAGAVPGISTPDAPRGKPAFVLPRFSGPAGEFGQFKARLLERFRAQWGGQTPAQRQISTPLETTPAAAKASPTDTRGPAIAREDVGIEIQQLAADIREQITSDIRSFIEATTSPTTAPSVSTLATTSSFDLAQIKLDVNA